MIKYTEKCAPTTKIVYEKPVENYVEDITVVGNNRYEVIPSDVPVKVYYDFDYNIKYQRVEDPPETFDMNVGHQLLKRILLGLFIFWKDLVDIIPIFSVSQSHRPTPVMIGNTEKPPKYSFHIIITNISATKAVQKYLLKNKINPGLANISKIDDYIYIDYKKENVLDEAVYGKGQQKLRSLNAIKDDEPQRPLLMMSPDELIQLPVVTDIDGINESSITFQFSDDMKDTIVTHTDNLYIYTCETEAPKKEINYGDSNAIFSQVVELMDKDEKYMDYALLINKELIGTHCGNRNYRFKFIKASQHIGISFDTVFEILKDAPDNDKDENYATYHQPERDDGKKVGWTTIKKLAELSNPDEKKKLDVKWAKVNSNYYVEYCLFSSTHYRLAESFAHLCLMYENEPIVAQVSASSDKKWVVFSPSTNNDNFKWNCGDAYIRQKIPTEFVSFFKEYKKPLNERVNVLYDDKFKIEELMKKIKNKKSKKFGALETELCAIDEQIKDLEQEIDKINTLIGKLECVPTQNNMMTELAVIYTDKDMKFLEELDKNPNLLCCANGVIDLKNKVFRPAKPADKCSKSTNIYYLTEHSQEILDDIDLFFAQVFRNEDLREYMWHYLASLLFGSNKNQTFTFFNGKGSNGKTKITDLIKLILGDYCQQVPLQLITEKRPSIGGTSSEIYALKGARGAIMAVPDKEMKINEGYMKMLTGGDPITCRDLYLPSVTFKPMFSLMVCCNCFFNIFSNDEGTWRRIKVVEFETLFKDKNEIDTKTGLPYVIDNESVWQKDRFLDDKMFHWKEAMLYRLVQIAFETQGIVKDCKSVTRKTKEYRDEQNRIQQFIDERLEKSDNYEVKKKALSTELKSWYDTSNLNIKNAKPKELYEVLNEQGFECVNDTYFGIQIKNSGGDTQKPTETKEQIFAIV